MGSDNPVVVTQKLSGFQGRVSWCVVVMKEAMQRMFKFSVKISWQTP
jgi:hypothetical protein